MKHIAFDLGAESGRVIVGQIIDGKLEMTELHRFLTQGIYINDSLRWDIYRLFSELKVGLKKYGELYGDEPCSMGVDTWGVDYGFLDKNGKLCANPYHYRDKRNEKSSAIIDEKFGLDRLYDLTGVQQMPFNTLNQLVSAKKADDSVFKVGEKLLFMGDLLHYFLCGETKSEYTIATTSNIYSSINSKWEDEILEAFDLDKNMMQDVVGSGKILGTIRADLASETGVSAECKIIAPAVHDTASAATALPGFGENIAYISSGTWSLAGLQIDKAFVNEETKKRNIANFGGSFGKILFQKNVMGLWLVQQSRNQWLNSNGDLSYADIVIKAQKAEPFYGFINVNDQRFLNPENMPVAICDYLEETGQKKIDPENVGQVARVIFEGLAMKYRQIFEMLSGVSGKKIDVLHVIGGGIQNKMLNQFTANAMGLMVVAGPIEATAIGNILMQAYGSGEILSLDELRKIVVDTFKPEEYMPEKIGLWNKMYEEFFEICQ